MPNLKEFFSNKERGQFPEVVVPLARGSATTKDAQDADSSSGLDQPASDEKNAGAQTSNTLTLEALRAEIEADIVASGHDTAYDRTFSWPLGQYQGMAFLISPDH